MKKNDGEFLNSKQQVLNKLGIYSEKELSNENVFRRFISMNAVIDKEVLGMILPQIKNFTELVIKQQEFISNMVEKQKFIDEKAFEGFNKTKEVIVEIIKSYPTMDTQTMIYLVDSLKEMDKYISDHAKESGDRIERLIKFGISIAGIVALSVLTVVLQSNSDNSDESI